MAFKYENVESTLYKNEEVNPVLKQSVDLDIRLLAEDTNGYHISLDDVVKIELDENMLSMLPLCLLTLEDDGTLASQIHMKIGDKVFIKLYRGGNDSETKTDPFIKTTMIIKSISYSVLQNNTYHYEFVCELFTDNLFDNSKYDSSSSERSIDVLKNIYANISLNLLDHDIKTNDNQLWLNCNNTNKDFILKVLEHSYISTSDSIILAPHFDSTVDVHKLSELGNSDADFTFVNHNYMNSLMDNKVSFDNSAYVIYESLGRIDNTGTIRNDSQYIVNNYVFDFLNLLDDSILLKNDNVDIANILTINTLDNKRSFTATTNDLGSAIYPSEKDYSKNEIKCEKCGYKLSNTKRSLIKNKHWICPQCKTSNSITKNKGDMPNYIHFTNVSLHFEDMYDYYDIAPSINYLNKISFFQNFIQVSYTVNYQSKDFISNPGNNIKIGDTIHIIFEQNQQLTDESNDGNYVVIRAQHLYAKDGTYLIVLTCVSNGINKLSLLD